MDGMLIVSVIFAPVIKKTEEGFRLVAGPAGLTTEDKVRLPWNPSRL